MNKGFYLKVTKDKVVTRGVSDVEVTSAAFASTGISCHICLDITAKTVYTIDKDMAKRKREIQQFSVDRRLMKMGGSLVVTLPNEVIEHWNLGKGDEVRISVDEGAIKIEPKQATKTQTISEEAVETYSRLMKGIQAKVTMDSEASALHIEFSGENREAVGILVRNLWRNLPFLLTMIGLGSVSELPKDEKEARSGRKKHGRTDANEVA